jgi:hypothetical protein
MEIIGVGGRRRDGRPTYNGHRLMIDLPQRYSLAQTIGERCLEFYPFGFKRGNSRSNTLDLFINFATVHHITGAHG